MFGFWLTDSEPEKSKHCLYVEADLFWGSQFYIQLHG